MNHHTPVSQAPGGQIVGICGLGQMGAAAAVAFERQSQGTENLRAVMLLESCYACGVRVDIR
jgi:hypothetical protein